MVKKQFSPIVLLSILFANPLSHHLFGSVILTSKEGKKFVIERKYALKSGLLQKRLEGQTEEEKTADTTIPIANVTSDTLDLLIPILIEATQKNADNRDKFLELTLVKNPLKKPSIQDLFDLINAANYLKIPLLLEAAAYKYAEKIKANKKDAIYLFYDFPIKLQYEIYKQYLEKYKGHMPLYFLHMQILREDKPKNKKWIFETFEPKIELTDDTKKKILANEKLFENLFEQLPALKEMDTRYDKTILHHAFNGTLNKLFGNPKPENIEPYAKLVTKVIKSLCKETYNEVRKSKQNAKKYFDSIKKEGFQKHMARFYYSLKYGGNLDINNYYDALGDVNWVLRKDKTRIFLYGIPYYDQTKLSKNQNPSNITLGDSTEVLPGLFQPTFPEPFLFIKDYANKLKELHMLEQKYITSIEGIEVLKNLERLHIRIEGGPLQIKDLTPLLKLKNLKRLEISKYIIYLPGGIVMRNKFKKVLNQLLDKKVKVFLTKNGQLIEYKK